MKFTIIKSCLARFSGIFALGTPSNIHGTAISYRCTKFGAFVSSVTILTLRDLTILVNRDWTRGAYFKTKGEEKVLMIKHMATETMFGDFYTAERTNFFGAILSLETDSVFMVTCFFCELLRENGRQYHK